MSENKYVPADVECARKSTHAGTIADPEPRRLMWKEKDCDGNPVVCTIAAGGGSDVITIAPYATDTQFGLVKLTDDPSLDAPAASDKHTAITPNGVKATIEDLVEKIESGEIGGGGGSGSGDAGYVVKPVITAPANDATAVSVVTTITATAFRSVFEDETRKHREFQVATDKGFDAIVASAQVNADSWQIQPKLNAQTVYYIRVRDVTNTDLKSAWSSTVTITTGDAVQIVAPTLTLHGYNDSSTDILSGLRVTASEFRVDDGSSDTHVSTSWYIDTVTRAGGHVWESLNDSTNKTSITVPDGTLQAGTTYRLTCIYHGTTYGDSAPAVVEFTTSTDFGTVNAPTLTVDGEPSSVFSDPTLRGGAFSNTRDPDTHDMTDWLIVPAAGGEPVWSSLNDSANKESIKVPNNTLQTSTAYIAKVRYHGAKYGWSAYTEKQFSTLAVFASVNTPTLTITGGTNDVPETPTLNLSEFGGTNVTYASTNWRVVKVSDSSEVWSGSNTANSITMPAGKLEVGTAYKFMGQHVANEGVSSAWAETVGTTKDSFAPPAGDIGSVVDGTFGVGTAPQEVYESLGLSELPGTHDPNSFQYGLYEIVLPEESMDDHNERTYRRQCKAYVKYVPKFYYAFLTNYTTGTLMGDETLADYAKYTGLTVAQLKEAQRRSPNWAICIAPAKAFTSEAEANEHGFILHRAFIDGGKEMPGFFIANTVAYYSHSQNATAFSHKYYYYFGAKEQNFYEYDLTENRQQGIIRLDGATPNVKSTYNDNATVGATVDLCRKFSGFNLATVFMWSALSMLSFAAGLYCKDKTECAWYKADSNSSPRGINTAGTHDNVDASVTATTVTETTGVPFVSDISQYAKTTHNGTITGVTNVNGWVLQHVLGTTGDFTKIMPESTKLADVQTAGSEVTTAFNNATSRYSFGTPSYLAGTWFTDINGDNRAMCGVCPSNSTALKSPTDAGEYHLFGNDNIHIYDFEAISVGGDYRYASASGIFNRQTDAGGYGSWDGTMGGAGVRLAGYPKI